jgi:hypothetical protein
MVQNSQGPTKVFPGQSFVTCSSPFRSAADIETTPMTGAGIRAAKLAAAANAMIRVIF